MDMGALDNLVANTAYLQAQGGDDKEVKKRRRSLSLPKTDQCAAIRGSIKKDFTSLCERQPIGKKLFREFLTNNAEYKLAADFLDELYDWDLAESATKDQALQNIINTYCKPDSKNFLSFLSGEAAEKCKSVTAANFEEVMKSKVQEGVRAFLKDKPFKDYLTSPQFDKFLQWKEYESQPINDKYFYEFRTLGKGGFGEVCAVQVKNTGQMYACKKLCKKQLKKKGGEKMALLEKKILEKVNSLFLVNLAYAYDNKTHLCLVMTLMNGGDLKYHIYNIGYDGKGMDKGIEMKRIIHYTAQIATGILHLHAMDIIYRDMKPENVLLDSQGQCRLSDLGLATEIPLGKTATQMLTCVSSTHRRGLNPPHRVKSISMTTFTQQEIEFLQKHSNEVCKHIWLGLYDDRTSVVPDFREPQKVKEFLQEKYEKKRWYVPPDQARAVASVQASVSGSSASSTGSTPEVQPLKTLQLNKTPLRQSPGLGRSQAHSAAQEKKFDLLSDLGGDIFAAPPTQTASSTNFANFAHFPSQSAPQGNSNTNFANFEAFGNTTIPSHLSTSAPSKSFPSGGGVPVPSLSSAVPAQSQTGSCTEDRYAALAELDNKLSSSVTTGSNVQGNIFGPVLGSSPAQNPPVLPSIQPGFGAVPSTNPFVAAAVAPEMTTNPFQTNGRAPAVASFGTGSMSMPAGFGNASSYCLPTSFSGNFQQQFPGQAPVPYAQPGAYHPQSNGPAFPVYGQNKPSMTPFGQPTAGPGMSNNPFMAGAPAGSFPSGGSSTNPFL